MKKQKWNGLAALGLSIPIGVGIGMVDAVFGSVLVRLTDIRMEYVGWLVPFLAVVGLAIVILYQKYGKVCQKGMALLFAVGRGEEKAIPLRLVPFILGSTWLTHLFGGSAGREGVAVQMGATISHWIGTHLPIRINPKTFLIMGMAAGFSGLFQTPLAATFFAMEVMTAGVVEYEAMLPALLASFAACKTSAFLGLEKFQVALKSSMEMTPVVFVKLLLLGIIFGMVGRLFAQFLSFAKQYFNKILPDSRKRVVLLGVSLSVGFLLLHYGRYTGLGTNLISASFSGETIYGYDWLFKFIFTIVTLSAGFQGGEVTPLFSIGASLGAVIAGSMGLPIPFTAALGYAVVFGSATNTCLAPILIGCEVFGYKSLPFFAIVMMTAYFVNGNQTIYTAQKVYVDESMREQMSA